MAQDVNAIVPEEDPKKPPRAVPPGEDDDPDLPKIDEKWSGCDKSGKPIWPTYDPRAGCYTKVGD